MCSQNTHTHTHTHKHVLHGGTFSIIAKTCHRRTTDQETINGPIGFKIISAGVEP